MKTMRSITIVLLVSCLAERTFAQDATIVSNTVPLVEEAPVRLPPVEPEAVLPAPADTQSLSRSNAVSRDLGIGATRSVRPGIRLLEDGAVADYGLFTVRFPAEITEAPITIITPNGRKLACRATFLALFDAASGQSLLLGEVQKTIGELDGDSTVLYPNAFDTVAASIRFRYTPYSLEQDILLQEQIQLPKEFQPENVQLEVWSAWIDSAPDAVERQIIDLRPKAATSQAAGRPVNDDVVTLGGMRIADGYAFGIQGEGARTPVAKTFARIGDIDWLIERVDYAALKPMLDLLPKSQASLAPDQLQSDREKLVRSLQARSRSTPSGQPNRTIRMAQARTTDKASVVVDFIIVSSVPAPSGLIAWWTGGGNPLDSVGNANATMLNGAGYGSGKVGQAFNLDGSNDRINATNSAALNFGAGADFSIEAWIKPLTNNTTYGVTSIVDKRNAPNVSQGLGYEISLVNGKVACRLSDSLANVGTGYGPAGPDLRMDGNFHHVAMTVDRDSTTGGKLYVDGAVVLTFDPTAEPGNLSNNEPVRIGNHATASLNCYFKGIIDEPSIYSRALSASEVLGIYNAGAAGKNNPKCITPPADIAGWWPGDGNAYDLARTNFGTLVGNTTYVPAVAGQGFSFDGSGDGVTISNNASLNVGVGESFSIEAWIQPLTNSTTYGVTSIVDKRVAPNTSQCLGYVFCLVNGVMNLRISDSISGNGANFADTQDLRIGSGYHHIAVTVNRGSTNGGHFYVDGVQRPVVFNPTVVSGSLSNAGAFLIGLHAQTGFNGGHKGVIDEVSFYRRELTNTEIAALYSAGGAGKCKVDTDGDGLTDLQETFLGTNPNLVDTDRDGLTDGDEIFVYHTKPGAADTDGDGLTDAEELNILIDASNPGLGHLDPLNPDTGSTGKPDGQKDGDHDGITNLGELRKYHSNASKAHTFDEVKNDAEYFHTAFMGTASDGLRLSSPSFPDGLIQFTILNAPPNAAYDLYFVPAFTAPPMKWRRIYCGAPGQRVFRLPQPDPTASYFVILDAADQDGDGLSDGYETWFTYGEKHTTIDDRDFDGDLMRDGWEVAYGIDPTDATGVNGNGGNPDGDDYPNFSTVAPLGEFNQNPQFAKPSYDPRTFYASTTTPARPVVSVSSSAPDAYKLGGNASFTITRTIGSGATLNNPLTVYYSVGGTATYITDYTLRDDLNNLPVGPPRVFSATIRARQPSVTVTVTPTGSGQNQAGTQTIIVKLTPFASATDPQIPNPDQEPTAAGCYVVDLHQEAVTLGIHNGILINLEKTAPQGYLRIKPTSDTTPLPFLNVANSYRGTVARIYTGPDGALGLSKVVGEYFSAPDNRGRNPSRTTVDRYGNVWVGNRAEGDLSFPGGQDDVNGGSIAQFGIIVGGTRCNSAGTPILNGDYLKPPFIYNTCIDRNRDNLVHTSRGGANPQLAWPNANDADSLGGVSNAQDEAILRYLRVVPTGVRTIIVDTNNNLWVGSIGNFEHEFIDATAAMQVTGRRLNFQAGGYGGVLDGYGAIWSSGPTAKLVRFLPGSTMPVTNGGTIRLTGDNYGIGVDPISGDVWQPLVNSASAMQFRADHCTTKFQIDQLGNRGVVVDGHGNIWVGGSADTVFHLTTSGVPIGAVPMVFQGVTGKSPLGLTVDSSGMIWAICETASNERGYAMRIDPQQNPDTDPGHVPPIGRVVEAVDLGSGSGPYNYSDMSGFVTLGTTQPSGVWDYVEDAITPDTLWSSLTMTANSPSGTRIIVEVRAANSIAELPSWPFRAIVNVDGVTPTGPTTLPSGIKGRYLEVRANLVRNFGITATPELRALTFQRGSAGCAIQITSHPLSKAVTPGAAATFAVTAAVPGGATPTYRWYTNGVALSDGGNVSGATTATLSVNNASYTDAARYSVKVGTLSGCTFQLESAPARLHVKGSPPQLTQNLDPTVIVSEGQDVMLSAQASAGEGTGEKPINYQWLFNNEPIAGASGTCGSGDCNISLPVAGQCINAGAYSVVFWNQYGQVSTVNCELSIAGRDAVSISPLSTDVTEPNQIVNLTATTCLGDVNCVQWYRIVGDQKVAVPNPGPNKLVYTIPTPMTCEAFGAYTVSIADRGWNSYEPATPATVTGPQFSARLTSTTLRIIPDNIGSGMWTYTWYYSTDGSSYLPVAPNPGTPDYTLATELSNGSTASHYYRVVATRTGATASMDVDYVSDTRYGTWVRKVATTSATLSVTYTAGANLAGGTFHWYFTPLGGAEEDTGGTTASYTISPVECSTRGAYSVHVTDTCGDTIAITGQIQDYGCP